MEEGVEQIEQKIKNKNIQIIWFDENINSNENQKMFKEIKKYVGSCLGYNNLEEGFKNYYSNNFIPIFSIISGKLWGRYLQIFKKNINKIINIPYASIFTSNKFKIYY